jgi:septum formation protein
MELSHGSGNGCTVPVYGVKGTTRTYQFLLLNHFFFMMMSRWLRSSVVTTSFAVSWQFSPSFRRAVLTSSSIKSSTTNNIMDGLPQPLILGSASSTRKLLLQEMGIDFVVAVRPIEERGLGDRTNDAPSDLVQLLANAKMDHLVSDILAGGCADVVATGSECIVLTADQVVTCNGHILEKPDDINQAKEFVARYGQSPCSTVGAIVLEHLPSRLRVTGVHTATIHFDPRLGNDASKVVDDLVKEGAPILSCAGGLMIEHPTTRSYVTRMEGTEDSIMGLCRETVRTLLVEMRTKLAQQQQKAK